MKNYFKTLFRVIVSNSDPKSFDTNVWGDTSVVDTVRNRIEEMYSKRIPFDKKVDEIVGRIKAKDEAFSRIKNS